MYNYNERIILALLYKELFITKSQIKMDIKISGRSITNIISDLNKKLMQDNIYISTSNKGYKINYSSHQKFEYFYKHKFNEYDMFDIFIIVFFFLDKKEYQNFLDDNFYTIDQVEYYIKSNFGMKLSTLKKEDEISKYDIYTSVISENLYFGYFEKIIEIIKRYSQKFTSEKYQKIYEKIIVLTSDTVYEFQGVKVCDPEYRKIFSHYFYRLLRNVNFPVQKQRNIYFQKNIYLNKYSSKILESLIIEELNIIIPFEKEENIFRDTNFSLSKKTDYELKKLVYIFNLYEKKSFHFNVFSRPSDTLNKLIGDTFFWSSRIMKHFKISSEDEHKKAVISEFLANIQISHLAFLKEEFNYYPLKSVSYLIFKQSISERSLISHYGYLNVIQSNENSIDIIYLRNYNETNLLSPFVISIKYIDEKYLLDCNIKLMKSLTFDNDYQKSKIIYVLTNKKLKHISYKTLLISNKYPLSNVVPISTMNFENNYLLDVESDCVEMYSVMPHVDVLPFPNFRYTLVSNNCYQIVVDFHK